jgi:hypothetical protein
LQFDKSVTPVKLTPEMKVLIERLSMKAALSVILQSESSLIQQAVLDTTKPQSQYSIAKMNDEALTISLQN